MFDKPRLALTIAYATFPNLAAFALIHLVGVDVFGYLLVIFVGFGSWYPVYVFCQCELEEFKRVNNGETYRKPIEAKRTLLDMNTGKPMYTFQMPRVQIDQQARKIRHMCIVLVNQREQGFKIDLREETWKAHFGGRDNFVQARDVRLSGAFAKESSRTNSPFVVVDWRIVEEGARGKV